MSLRLRLWSLRAKIMDRSVCRKEQTQASNSRSSRSRRSSSRSSDFTENTGRGPVESRRKLAIDYGPAHWVVVVMIKTRSGSVVACNDAQIGRWKSYAAIGW